MKNPIKNGKEVFAVLSMATVMSISMSVKVDAASDIEVAAENAAHAVVENVDNAPSANKVEETLAAKEDTAKLEDNKEALVEDTKATDPGSPEVSGEAKKETALVEQNKSQTRSLAEDAGAEFEKLEVGGNTPQAQGAGETSTKEEKDPNYSDDEKQIQDYDGSERYKTTDLQPGNVNQELNSTDEKKVKDGFKVDFKNPSETSPSKTEWGYQITIDKKTGQRTYTKIYVTDSGLIPAPLGEKPMMGQGDKLTSESTGVTFTPDEKGEITAAGKQRNFNYEASEETLKHINNKDNSSTSFGMKDNYTQDKPRVKFFGDNFFLGYKVNPWPNENDKLEELKLNTNNYDPKKKFFVQGQDIDTGIKVDNVDENAKERLVGQVYNPITGDIVPGASAYIGDDGNIHIKLPEGALKKDENGKTVINEDSIFNTPDYKALQNLDVKFFARPRTAEEFKKIAETPDEFGETGTYVGTGAGTADINHKGTNVTIDKQGIDRYDHYNLIGNFKLNLDDTRYYDQNFTNNKTVENPDDSESQTSLSVIPGVESTVEIYTPSNKKEHQKTADDMNQANDKGEASGVVDQTFVVKENRKLAEIAGVDYDKFITSDDYKNDRWDLKLTKGDIGSFVITPPKKASPGDYTAVKVEYTYTNGSKDVKWFHFVVQDTDNYKPEYHAEVGYKGDTLTTNHEDLPSENETNKNLPKSYELVPGTYKDSAGHVWSDIKVDPKTGAVTATVPKDADIKGGENLFVDIKVNYIDKKTGLPKEEYVKAQFIARPKYQQEVTKEFETKIPYKTNVVYDETLESGKVIEKAGKEGKQKLTFKQVVINDKKGIIDENGEFQEGKEAVTTEEIEAAVDGEVRIGTKPAETTVEVPFDTDYELDYTKKKGEAPTETQKGEKGEVTVKTTREPETGEIKITQEVTKKATNRKISIPAGTEGTHEYTEKKPFTYDIQFDKDFYTNYPDAKDNYKIVTEGKVGEKTTKWTIKNSEIVGEPEIIKDTDPTNAVIKVGQKDFTGEVKYKEHFEIPFEVEIRYNKDLPAGKTNEIQKGVKGSYDVEYTQKIKNGSADGEMTKEESNKVEAKKHIIEVGTKVETPEKNYSKEVEVEVEYVYDDTKDKGVVETGEFTPGKVETKVVDKYNPETGKVEQTTEEVVTKVKQKVIVGTKDFTGKYEYNKTCPISPNVIVRENPDMEAGTSKVVQEGKDGSKTTHVTVDIKNGKVVENSEKETPGETTEAVDHIIEVGTKKTPNTCPVPENPSTPNDQKPNGPKEEESGRPGESLSTPNTPNTPNKPGEDTSSEPGKKTPNKPGENPSVNPKNPPQESPEKPKLEKENDPKVSETEKVKEAEKAKEADEEIETEEAKVLNQVKKEEDEEASRVGNEAGKANLAGDDKAPKTGDAGLMAETASAGLASGLLLLLGRFKRKKEDEE
ncbi:adhesin domain containing protein [Peptoniphilus genitalis]|uniref:adhesin domain containing protein n=1 Tax=Peptoniphilus genitalis TaxID=3036303 RepID=UPI0024ADB81A|nr:adhesin domain containing protein [Peptoniphilus sp. Marseille-Q7072]